MKAGSAANRQVPTWLAVVCILTAVLVAGWIFYSRIFSAPTVDFSGLDPRNPENIALFEQHDKYYREHPEKRPRNWPPPQFTPESIARAREEGRKAFAEAEEKRAKVIQEYLKQQTGQTGR